jgi:hypothetical protein
VIRPASRALRSSPDRILTNPGVHAYYVLIDDLLRPSYIVSGLCLQAMATGLQLVSAYWFLRILRMVRYKLAGKKKTQLPPKSKAN